MTDVLIIGAGLAGLNCATDLVQSGRKVTVIDAADDVGGRVRTDLKDGFRLDRGFQVLLPAYSEIARKIDLAALDLKPFKPGAMVRIAGKFHIAADPLRDPKHIIASAAAPVGSLADKWKVAALRTHVQSAADDELLFSTAATSMEWLKHYGFSETILERFFKPFFGGIFLETDLSSNAGFLQYLFKMFSSSDASLPAKGMAEIPRQLASRLPEGTIRLNTKVEGLIDGGIRLANGEEVRARAVVIAVDAAAAHTLLPQLGPAPRFNGVTTHYYAISGASPIEGAWLTLNGEGQGMINNIACLSDVSSQYAPEGHSLLAVSCVGAPGEETRGKLLSELEQWFGEGVRSWTHLGAYQLPRALPAVAPQKRQRPAWMPDWLHLCGDHREHPSIQGAMLSGRRVAERLLQPPSRQIDV